MLCFVLQRHQRWKHPYYAERRPEAHRLWLRQAPIHGIPYAPYVLQVFVCLNQHCPHFEGQLYAEVSMLLFRNILV